MLYKANLNKLVLIAWSIVSCWRSAVTIANESADIIIVKARVYSCGEGLHEALAIKSNKILAVGSSVDIETLANGATRRIDAGGGTVTPGFNDSHVHFFSGSLSLQQVNLLDATSLEDIGNRIRSFALANPNDACIVGRGWLYGFFEGGLPTRNQLDQYVPDRPAIMKCYDGHTVWLNTKALTAAGIDRNTKDPADGIIVRDAAGDPTGVLKEGAMTLADKITLKPTKQEKLEAVRAGIAEAHRLGVTSVQEAGIGLPELEVLEALRSSGDLKLRFYIALEGRPRMTEEEIQKLVELRKRFGKLNIAAVKLFADGVIEAHTAAMLQPYSNNSSRGLPEYTQEDLNRVVEALDRQGFQVMIHAIGDSGIRMALDALERAAKMNPVLADGRRHRLEHIESVSREDIPRFGQLGVIASMQPYHANPNSNVFNVWAVNLGPERASRAWSWKSIQDAGGRLAFGTDWPVVGLDPRAGLHTALTRQTPEGEPTGGFIPEQRLTLRQALDAYTCGAAYAEFAESTKGKIAVGMLADLVIWDRDIFAVPVHQVKDSRIQKTIFDGQIVYESGP